MKLSEMMRSNWESRLSEQSRWQYESFPADKEKDWKEQWTSRTSGIPARYRDDADLDAHTEATVAVDAFMRDRERSLLLMMGQKGTGKSVALARAAMLWRGKWLLAADMAQAYRHLEYRQLVEQWSNRNLVVVDELGREPTDADQRSRATIWEIIERRWADKRKTILASNLTEKAFRERYDEPVWDRITGDGGVVVLTGKSMRQP